MKFGIRVPPPQMGPVSDPTWIIRYAKLIEELGFESVWVIDHAFMCVDYDSTYPYKTTGRTPIPAEADMPDPLILMTWIASVTERMRIGTSMLILPQRNPFILAKQVATLDHFSRGRVTLGVGVGWVKEEVEILKQDFHDRGRRADEWIEILRVLWQEGISRYDGEYFQFDDIISSPSPFDESGIPIMIGGHSAAAARRAGRVGNEFYPHWSTRGPNAEALAKLQPEIERAAEQAGRDPKTIGLTLTSTSDAATAFATAETCAELGAERVVVLPPKGELDGALPTELLRFKETVIDQFS